MIVGQIWEQRREKSPSRVWGRNGLGNANWNADTDQEQVQHVWKRGCLGGAACSVCLRLPRQGKYLKFSILSSHSAGCHLRILSFSCCQCSSLLEFPKQLKCHVESLPAWPRNDAEMDLDLQLLLSC